MRTEIQKILAKYADEKLFTHAFFEVGNIQRTIVPLTVEIAPDNRRVFDLASLTKLFATAILVADFSVTENIPLDRTLGGFFGKDLLKPYPPFLADMSILKILSHTSGLPAWRNFYVQCEIQEQRDPILAVFKRIKSSEISTSPVYSDLGYILLGKLLTERKGEPLDKLFADWCIKNKIAATIGYDVKNLSPKTIPTGFCAIRNKIIENDVHDENAAFMGEYCGHTGLFASGEEFSKYSRASLQTSTAELLIKASFDFKNKKYLSPTVGFRAADDPGSQDFFPHAAIGHYGFTGTSYWFHPITGSYFIFLSNRTRFNRLDSRIKELRSQLSKFAYEYCR